jgi:uncharacterized protein YjbJ (UPF0337 family)
VAVTLRPGPNPSGILLARAANIKPRPVNKSASSWRTDALQKQFTHFFETLRAAHESTLCRLLTLSIIPSRRNTMSGTTDKIKGKANELAGKAQQAVGKATDSASTQAKGAAREAKGDAQQVKGEVKDTVKK